MNSLPGQRTAFPEAIRAEIFVQIMMVGRSIETQSMNKPSASLDSVSLTFLFISASSTCQDWLRNQQKGAKFRGFGSRKQTNECLHPAPLVKHLQLSWALRRLDLTLTWGNDGCWLRGKCGFGFLNNLRIVWLGGGGGIFAWESWWPMCNFSPPSISVSHVWCASAVHCLLDFSLSLVAALWRFAMFP